MTERYTTDTFNNTGKEAPGVVHLTQTNFVTGDEKLQKQEVQQLQEKKKMVVESSMVLELYLIQDLEALINIFLQEKWKEKLQNSVLFMEVQKLAKAFRKCAAKNNCSGVRDDKYRGHVFVSLGGNAQSQSPTVLFESLKTESQTTSGLPREKAVHFDEKKCSFKIGKPSSTKKVDFQLVNTGTTEKPNTLAKVTFVFGGILQKIFLLQQVTMKIFRFQHYLFNFGQSN